MLKGFFDFNENVQRIFPNLSRVFVKPCNIYNIKLFLKILKIIIQVFFHHNQKCISFQNNPFHTFLKPWWGWGANGLSGHVHKERKFFMASLWHLVKLALVAPYLLFKEHMDHLLVKHCFSVGGGGRAGIWVLEMVF